MQGYQQRLILFALSIIVTSADTTINFFDAVLEADTVKNQSTVFANHIQLWANVTDCPEAGCACAVQIDGIEDHPRQLQFPNEKKTLGSVDISNLQSNTNYSLNLTCKGTQGSISKSLNIKTDYGRPSAPQNVNVKLISKKVQVNWLPPPIPDDSFNYYKIIRDKTIESNLTKSNTSYQMVEDYEDGTKHTFSVAACYINNQKQIFCSNSAETEVPFLVPVTITPIPTKSIGVHSYSISVLMIIFAFFLISNMKW